MDLKPFQLPAPRPGQVDVPLAALDAQMKKLALQKAYQHQPEPLESEFARLACEHPEACSCPADYPNWTPGGAS